MGELAKEIVAVSIEDELRQSYLDYAMSVIVGRALPDVRDGLKPVHRRVLFAMSELGNDWNKAYKKSARVVGDVIGKYHPHGDSAVYDTIVRMAQPFSMRYVLIDGQGNFGSVDGDSAAAMRYTEIRMRRIAHDLLADLDKETVDFVPNYDGTEMIPAVMPTRVPNLLINGSSGIAVGMATNIPPHNLGEVIKGCLALIENPDLDIDDLIDIIPGPDFPTGGIINGRQGIVEAYRTGRGRIYVRARAEVITDDSTGRDTIVIHEIPYQVNKARLIEKIAELVKEKRIEGISELRDESDKDGLRVVIEMRRNESGEVVLNNLYAQTQLQTVFGINVVALVDGQPRTLNLKEMLEAFLRHRREVVTRRTVYLLRKARERGHVLEGLAIALANIDEVIELIRNSPSPADARERLAARAWVPGTVLVMLDKAGPDACRPEDLPVQYGLRDGSYYLSPEQAQAILDLRLHRLTGLEHDKLLEEYQQKLTQIADYLDILGDPARLMRVIREELETIASDYADARQTEIVSTHLDLTAEDLIPEEERVVTVSFSGYAKSQPLDAYQMQRRGGVGRSGAPVREEDSIQHLLIANTHDTILCFSDRGRVYWLKVYAIPVASRGAKGRPLVNLLPLQGDERITSLLPVKAFDADRFVFMATSDGTVKKTPLDSFSRPRSIGLIAIDLGEGDHLVGTAITDGGNDVLLFSSSGKAVRFKESEVRAMGRTAHGVRGIRLAEDQRVVSLIVPQDPAEQVLTVGSKGYGKRTTIEDFPLHGRGGQGVIAMQTNARNGPLVGAIPVLASDEVMLISDHGTLLRTAVDQISLLSRNTQGVRVMNMRDGETLVGLARIAESESGAEVVAAAVAGAADEDASTGSPNADDTVAE
jgi:DNA gyrase subunit A